MEPASISPSNPWFGNPASVPENQLAEHVTNAHQFFARQINPSVQTWDEMAIAVSVWSFSKNPEVKATLQKIRDTAGIFARLQLAPHCEKLKTLLATGRAGELSEQGVSAETIVDLFRFLNDPKLPLSLEDALDVYTAIEVLEMKSLLPAIFEKLNNQIPACSIARTCSLYNHYQGKQHVSVQELLLMHLSVRLVPAVVYLNQDAKRVEITPEMKQCTLGGINLVDHPLFKAAQLLPPLREKQEGSDLPLFCEYSAQLPPFAGKWMMNRAQFRCGKYFESWSYITELRQRYPHWKLVVEAYDNWQPDVAVLPQVLPTLIAREPNNVTLRFLRQVMAHQCPSQFNAQSIEDLKNDAAFLLGKNPGYSDRDLVNFNCVRTLVMIIERRDLTLDRPLYEGILKAIEYYLILSYHQAPTERFLSILSVLIRYSGFYKNKGMTQPLSGKVQEILAEALKKYPEEELTRVIVRRLQENYPDILNKLRS